MTSHAISYGKTLLCGTLRVLAGTLTFLRSGVTPTYAYQSLIQLFCATGGRSNDLMAKAVGLVHRPYKLPPPTGVLGAFDRGEVDTIAGELREKGYHIFRNRLPGDLVKRLVDFAVSTPCKIRSSDEGARADGPVVFNRAAPQGLVCDFSDQDLVDNEDIQTLLSDPAFLAIAQDYLGTKPIFSELNLWWTSSLRSRPDSQAAQFFHFDMDRIRWLKMFIYLTDVGPDNGPHCFVAGSHRTGGVPDSLLSRGYVRLPDEAVRGVYPADKIMEMTGAAGTVIVEDTRGLHKGKVATQGDRLMLQLEFSVSGFGASGKAPTKIKVFHRPDFKSWVLDHPRLFQRWL